MPALGFDTSTPSTGVGVGVCGAPRRTRRQRSAARGSQVRRRSPDALGTNSDRPPALHTPPDTDDLPHLTLEEDLAPEYVDPGTRDMQIRLQLFAYQ